MVGWMLQTNAYVPGLIGAVSAACALPFTVTSNEPFDAEIVCVSLSRLVTLILTPGFATTGVNAKSLITSVAPIAAAGLAAAGLAGAALGGADDPLFMSRAPAAKTAAAAHTTSDPVSRVVMVTDTDHRCSAVQNCLRKTVGSCSCVRIRMTSTTDASAAPPRQSTRMAFLAITGGLISLSLGVYGRVHQPTGRRITSLFFPSLPAMKAWLGTIVFALALFQILSAVAMYGRLPILKAKRPWLPYVHRWSGTAAFLVSLPVGYHCLWALGFQTGGARQLAHSIMGCFFYGAFGTKLLCLHTASLPKWRLPVVGGLLVVALTGIWLTSSLWFFTAVSFPAL